MKILGYLFTESFVPCNDISSPSLAILVILLAVFYGFSKFQVVEIAVVISIRKMKHFVTLFLRKPRKE